MRSGIGGQVQHISSPQPEDQTPDAVQPADGVRDQRCADAFVIRMLLIGGERRPIGEVGDEAMHIATLDLLRAFAAPGRD